MAKKKKDKDPEGTARGALADAQEKLQAAQARRTRAVATGDQDVEIARRKAAARVEKTTRQVEQRAQKVARAEARLVRLAAASQSGSRAGAPNDPAVRVSEAALMGPSEAADRVEAVSASMSELSTPIVQVVSTADTAFDRLLDPAMVRALQTLADAGAGGCSYSTWLASSQLSRGTFLRVRKRLADLGLISRDGNGSGAAYSLTDAGASHLK